MCMIDEAIEMMQPGADLSDDQVARLETDGPLRETCEDIFTAQTVLARQTVPQPDAEAALRRFHHRQQAAKHRPSAVRVVRLAGWLTAAAALIAAVLILRPQSQPAEEPQPQTVFAAVSATQPVLVTAEGKTAPVAVARKKGKADATVVIGNEQFPLDEHLQLSVPYGGSLFVKLPDGTDVYMHPNSRLVYPNSFTGSKREVQLTGEAYFCVVYDAAHPFVVSTPQGEIRDYGTEFNVETVGDDRTEVVLVQGRVGVTPVGSQELMMRPGQMMTVENGSTTVREVDVTPYESWRDGYFHFEEVPLSEILAELGRYYNLSVVSYHPQHLSYRMRFIIPRDCGADYAVEMLNRMGKVSLTLDGDRIVAN